MIRRLSAAYKRCKTAFQSVLSAQNGLMEQLSAATENSRLTQEKDTITA